MAPILFNVIRDIIAFFVVVTLCKNYFFLVIAPVYPIREKLRYIRQQRRRLQRGLDVYHPKVSGIIPCWNERVGIIRTMESIIYNGYDNFELIVVNDGSSDDSDLVIRRYLALTVRRQQDLLQRIKYINCLQNGGKGKALNYGLKAVSGDIVLTVDADSVLRKGDLRRLTDYYLDDEIMAVVGNVEVVNTSTLVGLAQHLEYYFGFYNKRAHAVLGAEYIYGGACASFRAEVFRRIGPFDTSNKTEDIEMSMRTKYYGMKSTYAEDVVCYTEGASDIRGLLSQRVRWKKGRLDTFRKYRSMFFSTEEEHNFFLCFLFSPSLS